MKRHLLLFCLTILVLRARCQDLPTNPGTGLVSIVDSVDLKGKTVQEVKDAMAGWGHTLLDIDNLKQVYKLDDSRQTENVYINLPIGTILTQDRGNNTFYTNGSLSYVRTKTNGINAYSPSVGGGGVKFSLFYKVTSTRVVFEITNMQYSHDGLHYGRFESDKAPQDSYGASAFFGMSKKEWTRVRLEYFDKLKTLAGYLKQYITPILGQ